MKLLVDHNLSPRLVKLMADLFPNSTHVSEVGLSTATDVVVWNFAITNGFMIFTKDSDFNDLSLILGFPPKILWFTGPESIH